MLVAEAGRWARTDAGDVRSLEDGLLNVLGSLGMLKRAARAPMRITWLGGRSGSSRQQRGVGGLGGSRRPGKGWSGGWIYHRLLGAEDR